MSIERKVLFFGDRSNTNNTNKGGSTTAERRPVRGGNPNHRVPERPVNITTVVPKKKRY